MLIDKFKTSDYIEMLQEVCPEIGTSRPGQIHSEKLPFLRTVVLIRGEKQPGMYSWDDILKIGDWIDDEIFAEREDALDFDDPINIQYTSGTTGFPKGVVLTHHNLVTRPPARWMGSELFRFWNIQIYQ